MTACSRRVWALFMLTLFGLVTAPPADEVAPTVHCAQTLPSIPYWPLPQLSAFHAVNFQPLIFVYMKRVGRFKEIQYF